MQVSNTVLINGLLDHIIFSNVIVQVLHLAIY